MEYLSSLPGYENPQLEPIHSHMKPVHIFTPSSFKTYFNIILLIPLLPQAYPTEIPVFSSLLLHLSPILLSNLFSNTPSLGMRYEILKAVTECCCFLGCDAVKSCRNLSTFHRKLVSTLRVAEYKRLQKKLQIQGRENRKWACVRASGRWLPRR